MKMRRRELLGTGMLGGLVAMTGLPAEAQNFPSKPIRWIIPFAAAGNYDVTSRLVGEAMGRRIGAPPISWLMALTLERPQLVSLAAGFTKRFPTAAEPGCRSRLPGRFEDRPL